MKSWPKSSLMHKPSTTDAYLTLLVSLVITTLMSLILALLRGAGIGEAKMKSESVTEAAMESVLAEYHKDLFDRYDLLMVDLSYGSADGGTDRLSQRLEMYVTKSLSGSYLSALDGGAGLVGLKLNDILIPEYLLACDGDGSVFRRQILAYMRAEPVEDFLAETTDNISVLKSNGYDTRDVAAEREANYNELENLFDDDEEAKSNLPSEIEEAHSLRLQGVLNMTHPNPGAVSRTNINLNEYVSHRDAARGEGKIPGENLSLVEIGLIDRYIFEKCGNWSRQTEGSLLKYQIEYLIGGANSDYANLETVATTLLFWREASNFTYILTDSSKNALAEALAVAAALLILEPSAEVLIKNAILFAWSLAESIADMRALFNGGKVPLVKTSATWQTGIFGFGGGSGCNSGLDYEGYLAMLLYMTDIKKVSLRLMDVMEMDLRRMSGNENFRMDLCLDQMTAQFRFGSSVGWSAAYTRERGYETKYPAGEF